MTWPWNGWTKEELLTWLRRLPISEAEQKGISQYELDRRKRLQQERDSLNDKANRPRTTST